MHAWGKIRLSRGRRATGKRPAFGSGKTDPSSRRQPNRTYRIGDLTFDVYWLCTRYGGRI